MLKAKIKGFMYLTVSFGYEITGSEKPRTSIQDLDDGALETSDNPYGMETLTSISIRPQGQQHIFVKDRQDLVTLFKEIGIMQSNTDIPQVKTTTPDTTPVNLSHAETEGKTEILRLLNDSGLWLVEETTAGEEFNLGHWREDRQSIMEKSIVGSSYGQGEDEIETTLGQNNSFITYPSSEVNDNDTEVPACHQKVDEGLCRAFIPRWYFNTTDGTCNKFIYGGCLGNKNNFEEEHKCYAACKGEIPCLKEPQKVCRMSESPCKNVTCPELPEAECVVLPCTCEAVFEDTDGQMVNCNRPCNNSAISECSDASGEQVNAIDGAPVPSNEFNMYKVAMWSILGISFLLLSLAAGMVFYRRRMQVGVYLTFEANKVNIEIPKSLNNKRESFTEYSTTILNDGSGV